MGKNIQGYSDIFSDYPDLVDVATARIMLSVNKRLIYRLIDKGYFDAFKIGKSYRITKKSIIAFISDEMKKSD